MAATQPIRSKQQIREMSEFYLQRGQIRNYALIVMGLYTALRISDLLRLTWDHIYDFENRRIKSHIEIIEKKTKKFRIIALNSKVVSALILLCPALRRGTPLFLNTRTGDAISRIQAYRVIRAAAEALQLEYRVSCHSLRKTFGYHAWKSGVTLPVIMDIYNHSSLAVTQRYLGVTQDDKDAVYLNLELIA